MGNYLTNQIMYWGANKVSDHSRTPLSESFDLIERKSRMANGRLRKYVVASKKNWSTSWDMIPSINTVTGAGTVDGGMSGNEMEEFYINNVHNEFTMTLRDGQGNISTYVVSFVDFSKEIAKRGTVDLFNISVSLEEV